MTTIHDVARLAGVSPVTVSRVINSASNVNAATRAKVEQAIRELGYVPNMSARSLRSRQTFTLALIVPDITNAFWTTVARGVEDAAQGEGYSVLLGNSDENLTKQTEYIHSVLQQRVDGVIIAPYDSDPRNLAQLQALKTPTVVVDRRVDGWDVDTVRSDSISGAYALTQHLINLGHRRIAMISGPTVTSTAEERVAGYCLALDEAGIPIDPLLIRRGEYRMRSGRMLADQLLEEGVQPTAMVVANNLVAMGALESLQNHGKRVPQDVALVCFDELPDLARFYPFLTVAVQPAYEMGVNAAQLLLSRIHADAPLQPRKVNLPVRMVLRYSCGRLLDREGEKNVSLAPLQDHSETILVKSLVLDEERLQNFVPGLKVAPLWQSERATEQDQSNASRLLKVLLHRPADRVPHVEGRVESRALLEYVLQRSLPASQPVAPADYVEFARRMGIDAIACEIGWQPGSISTEPAYDFPARLLQAYPPPSLTEHFNRLETYLRAAQGSKVGVYASLNGIVAPALRAAGVTDSPDLFESRQPLILKLIDLLLSQQERTIRSICDRFSADLSFVVIRDQLLNWPGADVSAPFFHETILPRLRRLVAPVREHSLLLGLSTSGDVSSLLPVLFTYGFDLVQGVDPDCCDLPALREAWRGRVAMIGGFPTRLLTKGTREMVEAKVFEACHDLASGGGFVFSTASDLTDEVRPELFLAMTRALNHFQLVEPAETVRR